MARQKRPRPKWSAINLVIGFLKSLIKDPESPYWLKLACIDRIAIIDEIYDVQLGGITDRTRSLKKIEEPEPEIIPEEKEPEDKHGKELLNNFRNQFFNNGGKNGGKSDPSTKPSIDS